MILRIALPLPIHQLFDYVAPENLPADCLKKGIRVLVPFGRHEKIGFLIECAKESLIPCSQLKQVIAILDEVPLFTNSLLRVLEWTSHYYHAPLGEVFAHALPRLLRKKTTRFKSSRTHLASPPLSEHADRILDPVNILNTHQTAAVTAITQSLGRFQSFLLHGVTGSGKTEIYLQVISTVMQSDKQVLVLVPEISLTPQMLTRFQQRLPCSSVLLHSGLSEKQRLTHWLLAKEGKVSVILGTRSALFTPLKHPGLIIIDEEHDPSFKQQKGLRYHARDLGLIRAQVEKIPIILGSATASLESIANVKRQRHLFLALPNRAGNALLPKLRFIDLRQQKLDHGFSAELLQHIEQHLKNSGQILLFLNRRGFAPFTICHSCGWTANCRHCDRKMTFHKTPAHLQCHYCGLRIPPPVQCPACHATQLVVFGQGTQRIEATLTKYFPNVEITRIDRDNTQQKGNLECLLHNIHRGKTQILIGTQMLAKGHHFPNITLVGILEADNGLFSADFRALERTGQLITQVAGRAGRGDKPGEVLIQTYHPEHPLLTCLVNEGYLRFSQQLLKERWSSMLPPYSHLALVLAEAKTPAYPLDFLSEIKLKMRQFQVAATLLGPIPALIARKAGYHRAQLLFQAKKRNDLHNVLNKVIKLIPQLANHHRVRWSMDVDPLELN
jgi:primosomal protein N' (replication factor Y) (superfamily II helicase)